MHHLLAYQSLEILVHHRVPPGPYKSLKVLKIHIQI